MTSILLKVTSRGTIVYESKSGIKHEGYVGTQWAGKTVEVLASPGNWIASLDGYTKKITPYRGQEEQQVIRW